MTKKEAIKKAKDINMNNHDKFQPDITHIAMHENGLWYGYDQEPAFDKYDEEWYGWNWEIPLFDMVNTKKIIETVTEI